MRFSLLAGLVGNLLASFMAAAGDQVQAPGMSAVISDLGPIENSNFFHMVELCAGDGRLSSSYEAFNMRSKPMDVPCTTRLASKGS